MAEEGEHHGAPASSSGRYTFWLGAVTVLFAVLVALVWVPLDTATGLIERVRRQVTIGDALAPTIAAAFLGLGGLLTLRFDRSKDDQRLTRDNLRFVFFLAAILAVSLLAMRWAGPLVGALLAEDGYRPLRDTAPWKYIGLALGGIFMVTGLISFSEERVTLRAAVVAVLAVLGLILLYDVPFDDLLLPPNGDV